MLSLCDDILRIIIAFLDDECIILARVCQRLHKLVHDIHKTMLTTHNVFEAVRCNALLSFDKIESLSDIGFLEDMHASADMLIRIYDRLKPHYTTYESAIDNIVHRLCKMGKLMFDTSVFHQPSLIVHAITHGKHDLLAYMRDKCDHDTYSQHCAYGYAKIGDYDNFMQYYYFVQKDNRLRYCAAIGRDERIMSIIHTDRYQYQYAMIAHYRDEALLIDDIVVRMYSCGTHLIKHDDRELFARVSAQESLDDEFGIIIALCIRYNALKIMEYINSINSNAIYNYACAGYGGTIYNNSYTKHDDTATNVKMTVEMAELLLNCTHDNPIVVQLIVSSYNYRLTEMLRAKGLYNKKLTIKSSHNEFII